MTSPKLRAGPLAALVLFVVLAAAERVYVYEVESDFEIEDVPHVPGISWRLSTKRLGVALHLV